MTFIRLFMLYVWQKSIAKLAPNFAYYLYITVIHVLLFTALSVNYYFMGFTHSKSLVMIIIIQFVY